MATQHVPTGYRTVTPALIVRDADKAIDFYKRAFGAEEVTRMPMPDGSIAHAEIRIGDSIIMLGEENEAWGTKSPLALHGSAGSLHLYVEDADAAFAKALAEGASVKAPLEDAFWGDRYGKVTDPFGHEWGLATHVRDLTPEEMKRGMNEWIAKAGAAPAEATPA